MGKGIKAFYSLGIEQSVFYAKRHYAILRELIVNSNWNGSYSKLVSYLDCEISRDEVKKAVDQMLRERVIKFDGSRYSVMNENINDENIPVEIKKLARKEVYERMVDVLEELPPTERFASYSTYSIGRESYEEIINEYGEFRDRVNKIVTDDLKKDGVYQMAFGIFPTCKQNNQGDGNE